MKNKYPRNTTPVFNVILKRSRRVRWPSVTGCPSTGQVTGDVTLGGYIGTERERETGKLVVATYHRAGNLPAQLQLIRKGTV